jgi:hypothetical protein
MSEPKLFVAVTSTHGAMQTRFLPGMVDLMRDRTIGLNITTYLDPYIVLARNAAAADFLLSDCTHLLFIDADIMFNSAHVRTLVARDEDIVGGLYAKKAEGEIKWVCNALPTRPEPDHRGLLPVKHIGTGFLLIKKIVFERMIEEFGDKIGYLEDEIDRPLWDFFDMPRVADDKGAVRKLSEDWHFCNRARELGFTVYADTTVILRHVGTAVYPLRTQVAATHNDRDRRVA